MSLAVTNTSRDNRVAGLDTGFSQALQNAVSPLYIATHSILSHYVTSHPGQLSLPSLQGR